MSIPITVSNGRGFVCIISEKLPEYLITTSIQVLKLCDRYVGLQKTQKGGFFDWEGFKIAVDGYKGDDLAFDKYNNNTINQSKATVTTMVDKITALVDLTISVSLSESEIAMLKADIKRTFMNLKMTSEYGWADFSKSTSGHSSWEYRVLYMFPNPDLPNFLYGEVTTIKLEADIEEQSTWWGLEGSSSNNFAAKVDVMELVVMKGFKDPGAQQVTAQ